MLRTLRWMMLLYPADYRREFGEEMISVFQQNLSEFSRQGFLARVRFAAREGKGFVAGAAAEHVRSRFGNYQWFQIASRRIKMRSEFRYPRAAVPMMVFILAGVLLAIYKARAVAIKTELPANALPSLPLFGLALLAVCVAGAAGWFVLHSLHRSGVHRLSEAETWPQVK